METMQIDDSPVTDVAAWRFEELVRAGYEQTQALVLATARQVDLHLARDLLRRSCPPHLALQILI